MTPENIVKIMLDIEHTKKLQKELPSKLQVILVSIVQFFIGCGVVSGVIQLSNKVDYSIFITAILMLGILIIIWSAYTFFGYFYRKNHLLLLEALVSKNESSKIS